jgi:4-hydroxyproline epimerase
VTRLAIVDSHTAGEPTRVVLDGGPDLGGGSLASQRKVFEAEHDRYRSAIVNEPRGSDVYVGALLRAPADPSCVAGVIFFNNVGYLGMCGHGTIGLVTTLAHLGKVGVGRHRVETPVGIVGVELREDGRVTVTNVPSFRLVSGVEVAVSGWGRVRGDVAWGGNWFFLVQDHGLTLALSNAKVLSEFTLGVRRALAEAGVSGSEGEEIDHVELFAPSPVPGLDSRNFVMCPGGAYDRSPCGTGTSAKLACLHADGKLRPGDVWRQEGIVGTVFDGSFQVHPADPRAVIPEITGRAFITGEGTLWLDEQDPLQWGIREGA